MQKISDALARARQELDHGSRVTHISERAGRYAEAPPVLNAESIVYHRTRKVDVSLDLLRARRVVSAHLPGPYVDAYKILCTQVLQKLREKEHQILAVTSPGRNEGKTLTAINLACCMASEIDQTVLLVDANLRNPGVHRYFGLPSEPGLSEYLTQGARIEDILVNPGIGKFVILPGGRPIANSSELLGSQQMMQLVRELKSRYASRIVLFDLPPVLTAADVLSFSPFTDAVLLVVEEGMTESDRLRETMDLLASTHVVGTVLNKSRGMKSADPFGVTIQEHDRPSRRWLWKR
ncbi:MAG: CpsD/CapB family tyrosine-protein kinase [Burkholderiales bacterium]